MNISYIQFRDQFYQQSIFSIDHIRLIFPDFNTDNLLHWQKKGYIIKLRNKWYCFKEFTNIPDYNFLLANSIYAPSYISHQEALLFYGLIPEHIVDSVSITTKKTSEFIVLQRVYKYYSVKPEYFFGYRLLEMKVNDLKRNFMIADREKAILDLLYIYDFYKTEQDMEDLRLNDSVLENEVDWNKMNNYLDRFKIQTLDKKIRMIQKVYDI